MPPARAAVTSDVIRILTVFTGRTPSQIKLEHELQKDLQLRPERLAALAISLRGYVKQHNPRATIVARDVTKKDLTVGKLVDLVVDRIKGQA